MSTPPTPRPLPLTRIARLAIPAGLALLLFAACLCALPATPAAHADPGILYVDGGAGVDDPACGTTASPCRTISYTLGVRAGDGDVLRVAQGTYVENVTVSLSVTLEGGYEAAGWTRDTARYQTIIDGSADQTIPGDFDGRAVNKPAVIRDGAEFKMWYEGIDLFQAVRVGLVTSTDGISWTRPLTGPVLTGTPGGWDEYGEHAPFVLLEGGVYKMWYEGSNGQVRQLGYATSTNGIDWEKYAGNPVLSAGPDDYDGGAAAHGSVLSDTGTYKLWYHAQGNQGPIIAYATSTDGVSWTKQGPVLAPGPGGAWDEGAVWGPSVLQLGGTYWMWYSAAGPQGIAIGVVTSTDGMTWTRFLASPVLTETRQIGDPQVITDSGKLMMWYGDYDEGTINYAESTDGITWIKSPSNPVLTVGTRAAHWGRPVIQVDAAGVVLDGLTIQGGSGQDAGGVRAGTGTVIRDCLIQGNWADGWPYVWGGGGVLSSEPVTIVDSRIVGNQVIRGANGVRVGEAALVMTNTVIAGNRGEGGAIHANWAVALWNVTLTGNDGGLLFNSPATQTLEVTNSILYGNNGWTLDTPGGGAVQVTYSDIEGWTGGGTGNIDEAPLFRDADGADDITGTADDDYRLDFGSPAIESGTNTGCPAGDLDGLPRPADADGDETATCDMGAYEAGTMMCGVSAGNTYTFDDQSGVSIEVATLGSELDCLYVDEMEADHPQATGESGGNGLKTGRYWLIRALQADKQTGATGYTVTLTLPTTFTAGENDKVCRYTGSGQVWDCALTAYTAGSVTRSGVTELSDWAVGRAVQAEPGILYVDDAGGVDESVCGTTTASPCRTISYTLGVRAGDGDVLRVAQGTYVENVTVTLGVTLEGGYEAAGWTRDTARYQTIVDGLADVSVRGDFDGRAVNKPAVILDGAEFKMWYDGTALFQVVRVGLATSTDGISWTKPLTDPVLRGTAGAWDMSGEHAPFVLLEGGVYKMWYEGSNGGVRQLGYATSTNGIDWEKYAGNPVLSPEPGYDEGAAAHGSVLSDTGTYKLWYHALGDQGPIIAYATSADGVSWTKQGPVLWPQGGAWDEGAVWGPSVLQLGGTYWMWYSAFGPGGTAIGVVTSTDGMTWTRFLASPVLTETTRIGDPQVITDSGKLMMWYGDYDTGTINYAESTDGITWTKSLSNPVLSPGLLAAHWGRPVIQVEAAGVVLDGLTIQHGSGQEAGGVRAGTGTVIRDCLIRENWADGSPWYWGGGGVLSSEPVTIVDSRIVGNEVVQGASGVRVGEAALVMTNTILAGNFGEGGAIHANWAVTLWNVTLAGNDGGLLFNSPATQTLEVTNSILYGNNGWTLETPGGGAVQVTYSDIAGYVGGTNNIDEDPLFRDPDGADNIAGTADDDYRLDFGSPAIESGTNTGCPAGDLDGLPRPADADGDETATCDMGAYEAGAMMCGVSAGSTYTFDDQSGVSIEVTTLGSQLDCLYVDEMGLDHPWATGSSGDNGLKTGRYWLIRGLQDDGQTEATGYTVTLTLPAAFEPDDNDKVCRYTGSGQVWDCAMTGYTTSSVTRSGVTELSDWAVGHSVGPTVITRSISGVRASVDPYLAAVLAGLALSFAGLGLLLTGRRRAPSR